ncbi:MAG: hypothetical protein E7000_04405 [Coriobacteriaceae bacterium]|nr:hypothetical protein [Coriobacteriaceae bacterium]
MNKRTARFAIVIAIAAFSCLALGGCGIQDMDEETRKSVGMGLGMLILVASGLGYFISGRYFGRKRQRSAQRKRQQSKKKRR